MTDWRSKKLRCHSPMESGSRWRMFMDKWRSVRLERFPISSGRSSNLFSDTSSWFNWSKLPIDWKHRQLPQQV